jgi:hypothetical protein
VAIFEIHLFLLSVNRFPDPLPPSPTGPAGRNPPAPATTTPPPASSQPPCFSRTGKNGLPSGSGVAQPFPALNRMPKSPHPRIFLRPPYVPAPAKRPPIPAHGCTATRDPASPWYAGPGKPCTGIFNRTRPPVLSPDSGW